MVVPEIGVVSPDKTPEPEKVVFGESLENYEAQLQPVEANPENPAEGISPEFEGSLDPESSVNLSAKSGDKPSRKSRASLIMDADDPFLGRTSKKKLTELARLSVRSEHSHETLLSSVTTIIGEWSREYCLEKLKEDPNSFKAHYRLAFLEIDENDYTEHFKVHLEAVHRIKPDYKPVVVTLTLGEIYWSEKNYQKALEYYLKNKEVTEDKIQCLIRIGECYEKMGELDRAKNEYKKALKLNAKNPWVLYRLGKIFFLKGEHEKAAEKLYKSMIYEPDHYKCLVKYGLNFMAQKEPKVSQALETFDKALNLNGLPTRYEIICLKEKTNCLDRLNEVDSAIETCKTWVQLDPYNLEAKEYLAQLHLKNKENKKALMLYKQILKENRSNSKW